MMKNDGTKLGDILFLCAVLDQETISLLGSDEALRFIQDHLNDDPQKLLLKPQLFAGIANRDLVTQIISRKKAQSKLPEWALNFKVIFPESLAMEQCSSEETGIYKQLLVAGFATGCDLTGGFGVDSYFISKDCSSFDYIERQAYLCELAKHNFSALGRTHISVHNKELEDYLESWLLQPTDFVFCDPARRDENQKKVFLLEDCSPDVSVLAQTVLTKGKTLICKLSPMFDITRLQQIFGTQLKRLDVVSVKNECKEILITLEDSKANQSVHLVNLGSSQPVIKAVPANLEEKAALALPQNWLYEPNASVLKAGAGDFVANQLGLKKLEPSSQLYTSETLVEDYPGRVFKIDNVVALDKKQLATLIPEKKANISTRNFPMKPEEIYKKIGFKTGGDIYMFGTTLKDARKAILICRKAILNS